MQAVTINAGKFMKTKESFVNSDISVHPLLS
jgi:hypothetical protein